MSYQLRAEEAHVSVDTIRLIRSRADCQNYITYKGETLSAYAWAKRTGITHTTVLRRLRLGMPPEDILCTDLTAIRKQYGYNRKIRWITCNGETRSLSEWSRRTGLSLNTISDRLRQGRTPEEAIGFANQTYEFRGRLMQVIDIAKASGVRLATLSNRLARGWDIELAVTVPTAHRKPTTRLDYETLEHQGQTKSIQEWANIYKLNACTIRKRLRDGWTLEQALSLPLSGYKRLPEVRMSDGRSLPVCQAAQELGIGRHALAKRVISKYHPEDILFPGNISTKPIEISGVTRSLSAWAQRFEVSCLSVLLVRREVGDWEKSFKEAQSRLQTDKAESSPERKRKLVQYIKSLVGKKAFMTKLLPQDLPDSIESGFSIWRDEYTHHADIYMIEWDQWTHSLNLSASFDTRDEAVAHACEVFKNDSH